MSHNPGRPKSLEDESVERVAGAQPKAACFDEEMRSRVATTIARVYLKPIDPAAPNLFQLFADIFRQRAGAGWTTPLSPETALLVADALEAYAPKPPALPLPISPDARCSVDMYASGSTIYRLFRDGEIFEIAAWARSTLVARAAYDKLIEQYPGERFMQKRRSWVERDMEDSQ